MKPSKIGWADFSGGDLNFVTGCTAVSPGCAHCYARVIYERFGKDFSKVEVHYDKLAHLNWGVKFSPVSKRGPGCKPLAFICDTGDLFHPDVPASFITHAFEMMESYSELDFAVLTKRPERIHDVLFGKEGGWYLGGGDYIPNVWLGVTTENQAMADKRIPYLEEWQGVRWVSVEPMLEGVDLAECAHNLHWVVCGGESGANRRPFEVRWAEGLFDVCMTVETPFFYKQGSGLYPGMDDQLPGYGQVKEWPESLAIR